MRYTPIRMVPAGWTAVLLAAMVTATTVQAAAPALQGQITLRPLTPSEIKDYALTNAQGASGLTTVGKGQPAYLEVLVNNAVTNSDITNIVWTLAVRPAGSAAALAASPLGTNVPTYKRADRYGPSGAAVYKVPQVAGNPGPTLAGRTLLLPDVTGLYTVTVTIQTASSGSTNLTQNITAGTYMGINTCSFCHSGGVAAPDKYTAWSQTLHATMFTEAIDGLKSSHYGKNCISCHTVGYDANTNAVNGGFDDVATQLGWTFPTNLIPGNWAALTNKLKNLANIQCENCHGPGSEHAFGEISGPHSPEAKAAIGVTFAAGDCAQCHDSTPNHSKSAEWNNSLHARSARQTSPQCVRCHTGPGFIGWATAGGMSAQNTYPTNIIAANEYSTNILTTAPNTNYEAITCQACHDPHDASNPHQLRLATNVTLSDGTVVTNAGNGGFCMECHNSRNGSVTNMMAKYPTVPTTTNLTSRMNWAGGASFGTHDSPQGDMLEGVNAITYGKVIPSSAHANSVSNTCVGCHMQTVASTDPAFLQAGGHTFHMTYTNSAGVTLDKVDVCVQCHGPITSFNMVKVDYNGDGVIEGVQTEVQHLMDKLSTLVPAKVYQSNPANYIANGLVKTSLPSYTNMPMKFLNAAYNYQFVAMDNSKGVHNAAYAVGLLKASIGDLTGDNNDDGLPDTWQAQYFGAGFATNALAGLYGVNNTNGIPNWMMYAMGLDPTSGSRTGSGVIYVNEGNVVNGATNTIAIYTAAEIAFDTVPGTTYQIQGITALTGSWQNIGTNIVGTGNTVSYVTPTRGTTQMFYRVAHTP